MSPFLLYLDEVIEPRAEHDHGLPADLRSYQEHLDQGTPVVLEPSSGSLEQDGLRPDAYRVTINEWGAEVRTPLYARERARRQRLRPNWTETDMFAGETADRLRVELHNDASIAFLAGRTAACCGRISELAVFDSTGQPIFDQALAPHNGERRDARGVEEFWAVRATASAPRRLVALLTVGPSTGPGPALPQPQPGARGSKRKCPRR